MPREATITYDQVAAVADAIKAEGGRPNSRNVRERLGQGSMGTIHKLLTQWQAGQARHIDAALTLPPPLQRAILEFMSQELASARAGLEAELVEAQQAATDLATENERQGSHVEALQNAIEDLKDEDATMKGQLAQMEKDLASAREEGGRERQEAERARTELAKALLQLEGIPRLESELDRKNADLAQLREQLQQAQAAIAAASQAAAVSNAKLEACQAQAQDLDSRRSSAEQSAKELGQQVASLSRDLQACQLRAASVEREAGDLREEVSELRREVKRTGEEAAELRGQLVAHGKVEETAAPAQKQGAKAKKPAGQGEA